MGLHRHQLEGGVTEIRSAQLRFSLDEARRMAMEEITAVEEAAERALDLAELDTLILPFMVRQPRSAERRTRFRTAHGAFIAEILDAAWGRSRRPDSRRRRADTLTRSV